MSKRVNLYIQDELLWKHFTHLVGRGNVSKWIENTIRALVDNSDLVNSYKQMALDTSREKEANEWLSGTFGDVSRESW
jgi:hypothetical protein